MACCMKLIEEEGCVCLSFDGEVSPRELAVMSYEARGQIDARRFTRMMVNITRLRSSLTAPQLLDFTQILAGQVPRDARLALVVRPDQARQASFAENVARRSGVFMTYFLDPEKAARWVKQTQAPVRRKLTEESCLK